MDEKQDQLRSSVTGRFTTIKNINKYNRIRKMGLKNSHYAATKSDNIQVKKTEKSIPVEGNRIVDLDYMSEQMICSSCGVDLLLKNVVNETRHCLGSYFDVKCTCGAIKKVLSSEKYTNPASGKKVFAVNTKMTLASLHAGGGITQTNKYLSLLDLPVASSNTYKMHERIIGPLIEKEAKESCIEAVLIEKELTEKNIEALKKTL